jgi:S-adenosylmethionine:tRNA ribosyltransferase-isomerase
VKIDDFDFPLPEELIAQRPAPQRDASRLMVVHRHDRRWEHHTFRDLPTLLVPGDLLVWNTSRVFPARLRGNRPGRDETVEILLVRELSAGRWLALVKPGRKAGVRQSLEVGHRRATVLEVRPDGSRVLGFENSDSLLCDLEELGTPPLPHYIRRDASGDFSEDRIRYQTVYARESGSVAAPTAGLHFTPDLIRRLDDRGVVRAEVLLHVGYGTFQPVRVSNVEQHRMHPEPFVLSERCADSVNRQKASGRRVVAVGTTSVRVLESVGRSGVLAGSSGECDLFIYPGFQFRIVDALVTNFHLPRSTLFMLVSAFAGRELMLASYAEAVKERYRFFSYGDGMLIL